MGYLKSIKMAKKAGGKKKRSTSNVFSQFEQSQIQEFKEALQMIDADRNGIITVGDLKATYASLGVRDLDQDMLDNMCAEAGAPINFTIFLNMLADKLHGTDQEDVIVKAFKLFDKENKGVIPIAILQDVLRSQADRFNEEEFKQFTELAKPNEKVSSTTKLFATPSPMVVEMTKTRTKKNKLLLFSTMHFH